MNILRKFIVLGTVVSGITGIGVFLGLNENSKEEKYQTTENLAPTAKYGPRMTKHRTTFNKLSNVLRTNEEKFKELKWKVEIGNPDDDNWWSKKWIKYKSHTTKKSWEEFQDWCFLEIENTEIEGQNLVNSLKGDTISSSWPFISGCLEFKKL